MYEHKFMREEGVESEMKKKMSVHWIWKAPNDDQHLAAGHILERFASCLERKDLQRIRIF